MTFNNIHIIATFSVRETVLFQFNSVGFSILLSFATYCCLKYHSLILYVYIITQDSENTYTSDKHQ